MPEYPCRQRFRIHLSTAIVMMLVAGGLTGANMRPNFAPYNSITASGPLKLGWIERGWPFRAHTVAGWSVPGEPYHPGDWELMDADGTHPIPRVINSDQPPSGLLFLPGLAGNVAAAIPILFAVWFLCEKLIRRRAVQNGKQ